MKERQYKTFSLSTHKKNWRLRKPNVCQFELTFNCDFHCLYCYSDCYNNPADIKKELSTKQVKFILDKVYKAGCIWLCFTGGDPLKRKDFLEIYAYAKKKGFIISIFTNGYSLTEKIANFLKSQPPFVIEMTLNSVNKKTFAEISQVPDSFEKTIEGINMLIKRRIPIKIKTMVLKNNFKELPELENFVNNLALRFQPSPFIQARLDKDTAPCSLRVSPEELFSYFSGDNLGEDDCYNLKQENKNQKFSNNLFNCAAGSLDGISIDPYGRMFFCNCLREPSIDLLKQEINEGLLELFPKMREKIFTHNALCGNCLIRRLCRSCPGKAFLEKYDLEGRLEWFCKLAHFAAGKKYHPESVEQKVESYV
jgi:radical SAM protein with 4Fe4S-binding SPASM domain